MGEPDTYTLAWWREQFKGLLHQLGLLSANCADLTVSDDEIRKRLANLEAQQKDMVVQIGRLQDKLDAMGGWLKTNCSKCKKEDA